MPEPLTVVTGIAASIPGNNIDTDVIMPKRFLKTINRQGLATGVFADLRFDEQGRPQPGLVLNHTPWNESKILVVGDNFGCGSSREHAVWGLYQLGIRVLVGTSFAGIFFDNCRRNGLAALTLNPSDRDTLSALATNPETCRMTVNLETCTIQQANRQFPFTMADDVRNDLLAGRDAIATTLQYADRIKAFEANYLA